MGEQFDGDTAIMPERLAAEMRAVMETNGPLPLGLQSISAFQLAALIQLACRHPGLSVELRAIAARFLEAVREYFADCPAVLEVLRRGDEEERLSG